MGALRNAMRTMMRPRWLAVAGVMAVGVTPVVLTGGGAHAAADTGPISNPAHPVVDANWIYANDFYDATHFIYKRAGSDGCLPGATSCAFGTPGDANNLPMNYNGTQEFNKWWGDLGTTSTPQPMGVLGKFMSKRDHLFAQATWQINTQELTIPGATCPGQQVMLAYHPDSQGVTAPNPGTSATPYSSMYSGDWGTGSPYDSNMGAIMNLEEIGSVLRWHSTNGTYPKRTIKSAVYDAELQGLIGSGFYSSTGSGTTSIQAPVSAGSLKVYVAANTALSASQTSGFFAVGQPVVLDNSATENNIVTAVGTAIRTASTLSAAAAAGDTNIKVASVANMVAGEPIRLETFGDAKQEFATIQTVGTAGATGTGVDLTAPLTAAHASGVAAQDLGSGITLATPLAKAHAAGSTINGPTAGLISDGPQGQIVGVLNNDQNGINYPALHWGTDHYLNDLVNGGVGPWFNNINATPTHEHRHDLQHGGLRASAGQPGERHGVPHERRERRHFGDSRPGREVQLLDPGREPADVQEHGFHAGQPAPGRHSVVPAGRSGEVHAGQRRPHRPYRPGVVRQPRHPVAGQHRRVRLQHQPGSSAATRTRIRRVTRASRPSRSCTARTR